MISAVRDRWFGWARPAFDHDCSPREPWAVYVIECASGPARTWTVVGRLLQRPWTRVGGGGEHDCSTEPTPEERAAARGWLTKHGMLEQAVWFPQGSLLSPSTVSAGDLRPYWQSPTHWAPEHTFASLSAARAAAQRMANVVCPHDQTRRSWPGGSAGVDGRGLPELAPAWLYRFRRTLRLATVLARRADGRL